MRRYLLLVALYAIGMGSADAEVRTLPENGWKGLRIERSARSVQIKDAVGHSILSFRAMPVNFDLGRIGFSIDDEGLSIDAGDAFRTGLVKLSMTSRTIDHKDLEGQDCSEKVRLVGPPGSELELYYEGHVGGRKAENGGHYYRFVKIFPKGRMRDYPLSADIPFLLTELHLRLDICKQPVGKPIRIAKFVYAPEIDLPVTRKTVVPELLFKVDFDGNAKASVARGSSLPTRAEGLSYAPGVLGQAVRIAARERSLLEYSVKGNVDPDRGAVSMWVKREWNFNSSDQPWRTLFAFPWKGNVGSDRVGSGAHWFWFFGTTLRADQSDDEDRFKTCSLAANNAWTHLVYIWDEEGVRFYVNGKFRADKRDGTSPMVEALRMAHHALLERPAYEHFTIGNRGGTEHIDGLIDDLRIYSAPLSAAAVDSLWREHASKVRNDSPRPDYERIFSGNGSNSYVGAPIGEGGAPDGMELVEELKLDQTTLVRIGAERYRSVGRYEFKELGGTPYLETGANAGARAAFRFNIDTNAPLYCFEFDYPDDAKRTADLIVQPCRGGDYILQVGYAAGDEYPNSGKILTHRCIYWSHVPDVAVVLMTARDGAPAALSAIRLYKVRSGSLPEVKINEPEVNADGWRRSVALYFEDPAIGFDFGIPESVSSSPAGIGFLIDRVAAKMKYTGENVLAYPGAWYHGLIGDDYMPRKHAPDFLKAWYIKFGNEGLGVVPTVHSHTMPVEDGLVTRDKMVNGALHHSEISIHATGKPNWGKWHDTPPNFNFHHPRVRNHIEHIFDTLVKQGRDYPAFKGVCMHMTRHSMLWFGDEESGYNDYTVRAFAEECGIDLPFGKFASNPLRGKDYEEWIRDNCWEQWIGWRCGIVTAFYVHLARKLAATRSDLKLWLNSFVPANYDHPDFMRPDFMEQANRRCGLDGPALTQGASNIILCQTLVPADYRWRRPEVYKRAGTYEHQRILDTLPGFYSLLKGADYPWVNQHDRYWESAIGRGGGTLTCPWMVECGWRVSTINPSGRHALRHFVLPFRYYDVLGLSKGGFLIGTYGMEDVLVPFVRAFRSLPAVVMNEIGRRGNTVVRHVDFKGWSYFYVCNTEATPVSLEVCMPSGTKNLVSGEEQTGPVTLHLAPYDFKSFRAPEGGIPVLRCR